MEIVEHRFNRKLVWFTVQTLNHSLYISSLKEKAKFSFVSLHVQECPSIQWDTHMHSFLDPLCFDSRSLGMHSVPPSPASASLLLLLLPHLHFSHQEWLSPILICPILPQESFSPLPSPMTSANSEFHLLGLPQLSGLRGQNLHEIF